MKKYFTNKCATKNGLPISLLKEWDYTCQEIKEEVARRERNFKSMTNREIAEYIVEELEKHSPEEKESQVNVIQKALIDLRKERA